ncbi:MAG TPA: metalloregulator ArsR/SmtB family transcription factor [Anaerolineae bacterium]|nr:metalloregulator ArsR/SmtB family transcription factor [Anaerolineae bacterium]HOQ99234.1 metalloregulator ArsR/SmtB family transcription factor [Anaerolineae bacterium]HPL28063.1 metalloregulator ArsR/SmtB family transcription factor [Anaerolineae bacterium]
MREDRCEVTYIDEERVRAVAPHIVDGLTATRLAELFQALGDPTRVRIISALSQAELCVCDLAASLGMSQSAISHQLRLLRSLRLVRRAKRGRMVYYALDDDHILGLFTSGMEHVTHE